MLGHVAGTVAAAGVPVTELHDFGTLGFLDGAISYADLQRRFSS